MSLTERERNIRSRVGKTLAAIGRVTSALRPMPDGPHPYLEGLHKRMEEEVTLEALSVTGTIPPTLAGRYLRIGPNPVRPPNPKNYHWFTGDGMAHGVRIKHGKALWYRNRWVRSTAVSQALGEAPLPGPRGPNEVVNTNILRLGDRIWALSEAGSVPVEMSDTLETIAHNPFDGGLENAFSAHPHIDPHTGEAHAICYRGGIMDRVWHVVLDRNAHVVREEAIKVAHGPSIHDCQITPHHVLLFDLPITFSLKAMLGGRNFPYRWNPQHKPRVGLLGRNAPGESIIWYDVAPCYIFHTGNAFEDEQGRTQVDVVVHDHLFDRITNGPDESKTSLERWTFDPASRSILRTVLDSDGQEFPRYDERRTGAPYRYLYTVAMDNDQAGLINDTRLIKQDLVAGSKQVTDFGPARHPGEFVFVPSHAQAAEDEGWLIGLVVDANKATTDLMILDAQNFENPPQAIIHLPHHIPPGFHGNWVED